MKPAKRVTNIRCREEVQNRRPFKGSNLRGFQVGDGYVVLSYDWWPMFIYSYGHWKECGEKYSQTTSKQQSQAHPHCETIKLPQSSMVSLYAQLKGGY
jgi:hypothetical protein